MTADGGSAGRSKVEDIVRQSVPLMRRSIAVGVVIVAAIGGVAGWLGYQAYEGRQGQQQRDLFLQVGRQAAVNLTTISHNETEADVQRILDSATGAFRDDFEQRSPAFIEVVKRAQVTTEGTVTAAGLESETASEAQVLVTVSVTTSNAGAPEQDPRAWRMRIGVQRVGNDAKMSSMAFMP